MPVLDGSAVATIRRSACSGTGTVRRGRCSTMDWATSSVAIDAQYGWEES
ncbi:hypothetical protein SAV31267_000760 [Streptomyces avermitilis]|uniref:Uncharacterized protein n=1 Tax=Streptomyces avermitilis TaxID=33903 RepID=A0A4D4MF29_STRAX|nr:hypothetical protein SAV31267_000760 [Streptomyces avermitilis]